jgi:hypothetical protein
MTLTTFARNPDSGGEVTGKRLQAGLVCLGEVIPEDLICVSQVAHLGESLAEAIRFMESLSGLIRLGHVPHLWDSAPAGLMRAQEIHFLKAVSGLVCQGQVVHLGEEATRGGMKGAIEREKKQRGVEQWRKKKTQMCRD